MDNFKWWVEALSQFLRGYKWLLDAYVIEFFTENHWRKLPMSWQASLTSMELAQVSRLLLSSPFSQHRKEVNVEKVYPLSLLAFVATAHTLSVSRQPPHQSRQQSEEKESLVSRGNGERESPEKDGGSGGRDCSSARDRVSGGERGKVMSQVTGLEHVFRRHVKPKKQHEIKHLAEEIVTMVGVTGCKNIIDIGSGQGHLSRYLTYHCGLNVVTVEAAGCHLVAAAKFDSEVERDLTKKAGKMKIPEPKEGTISHIESTIESDVSLEDLLFRLGLDSEDSLSPHSKCHEQSTTGLASDSTFILVGLHTCGDLAPTMLHVYAQSSRVVGLLSVGCCFMKLSCEGENECKVGEMTSDVTRSRCGSGGVREAAGERKVWGYPMSDCLSDIHVELSYEAREVACHSIDTYRERISSDSSHHVMVHCHRAAVETILRKHGMRRSQVKISRRISKLPFKEYASAVLESLGLPLSELETSHDHLASLLSEWREVATFFMLRLLLAPCVETVLMLDRVLYLREKGCKAQLRIQAVFDAALSPRNLLISSYKL